MFVQDGLNSHTIVLLQPLPDKRSRTYLDFETVGEAVNGAEACGFQLRACGARGKACSCVWRRTAALMRMHVRRHLRPVREAFERTQPHAEADHIRRARCGAERRVLEPAGRLGVSAVCGAQTFSISSTTCRT